MNVSIGNVDGIAVRSSGTRGQSVLWIHGYTLSSEIWTELWCLMPDWRHFGVDLPGHGASRPLTAGEDLATLTQQLLRIAVKLEAKHLVGISFGGMIALQLAIEAPDSFASLTLGSPALGGGPQDPHAQARNLELALLYRKKGRGRWLREAWMHWPPEIFKGAAAHPDLWARLCRIIDEHGWCELADTRMQRLVGHPQSVQDLQRIRAATLVVIGEEDMGAFKRTAELIRRTISNSRRVYLPEAGHLSFLEAPVAASRLLESHLRACAAGINDS